MLLLLLCKVSFVVVVRFVLGTRRAGAGKADSPFCLFEGARVEQLPEPGGHIA